MDLLAALHLDPNDLLSVTLGDFSFFSFCDLPASMPFQLGRTTFLSPCFFFYYSLLDFLWPNSRTANSAGRPIISFYGRVGGRGGDGAIAAAATAGEQREHDKTRSRHHREKVTPVDHQIRQSRTSHTHEASVYRHRRLGLYAAVVVRVCVCRAIRFDRVGLEENRQNKRVFHNRRRDAFLGCRFIVCPQSGNLRVDDASGQDFKLANVTDNFIQSATSTGRQQNKTE